MKFEATQSGTEARKGRQGQGIEHTCPTQPLCPPPRDLARAGSVQLPPSRASAAAPLGLVLTSPGLCSPQAHPSMARQTAGPTHLSRTAWMASAALS